MKKASDIITALFNDHFGPDFVESARVSAGLFSSWDRVLAEVLQPPFAEDLPSAVGTAVNNAVSNSRIRELEKGVLLIEADHPGWIQILQTKQEELLLTFQHKFPELDIRGISFKLSAQRRRPRNTN